MASTSSPATEEIRHGNNAAKLETSVLKVASAYILRTVPRPRSSIELGVRIGTGRDVRRSAPTIFHYHLDTVHGELSLDRCDTGKYCCHNQYIDCCGDKSQQFGLSNHNPSPGNATESSDEGGQNETDASSGAGSKIKRVPIGAAVGGALGGLAMIGSVVGVWMYLRKKKIKQEKGVIAQDEISGPREMEQVLEMGADSVDGQKCTTDANMKDHSTVVEVDATVVYELGS
ncbi:hypothetical protein ACHAPE_008323 [Trichoderma viride]